MIEINTKDFDKTVLEILENLSKALEIEPAVILENIFIKKVAQDHAEGAVFGKMSNLMTEFAKSDGKVRRGQELYNAMFNEAVKDYEAGRLEQIQATGIPFEMLPPEDKEILKRYKLDPEYKKEKEEAEKEIQRMIDSGELEEPIIEWNNKKE